MRGEDKSYLPLIRVLNPVTHHTWNEGRYTTYNICIQTQHKAFSLSSSSVQRRFSEFAWLRKQLNSHHPTRTPPNLPPKKFFVQRFDEAFIKKRQDELQKFLNSMITERMFLSDTVLHLFLQTNLTTADMEDFIAGHMSEEFINQLWIRGGKKISESSSVSSESPSQMSVGTSVLDASDLSFPSPNESTVACAETSSTESQQAESQLCKGDNSANRDSRHVNFRDIVEPSHFSVNFDDSVLSD